MKANFRAVYSCSMSKEFLVKVFGTLQSSLATVRINLRTTTLCLLDGGVANETNPFIAMIKSKCFSNKGTLSCMSKCSEGTRSRRSTPRTCYNIMRHLFRLCGRLPKQQLRLPMALRSEKEYFSAHASSLKSYPYWGDCKCVSIVLNHESINKNAEPGHKDRPSCKTRNSHLTK